MIIENHSVYKINENFREKHFNLLNYFQLNNLDIEISDKLIDFETFLKSLSTEEKNYPYDESFNSNNIFIQDPKTYFCLLIKNNEQIVATYSARNLHPIGFVGILKSHFSWTNYLSEPDDYLPSGKSFHTVENPFYSSNLWLKSTFKEKKIDIFLDHLKKNIIFDIVKGDINYSVHKEKFKDYHLNDLLYERSEWIGTINDDNLVTGVPSGKPTMQEKNYHLTWVFKDTWENKHNETKLLYL